jgi:hypothetical protein
MRHAGWRTLLGLAVLAVGIFVLSQRLGRDPELMALVHTWWPIALMVLGLANLIRLVQRPWAWAFAGPLGLVGAGSLLLLHNHDRINPKALSLLWPIALILAGVWIALAGASWHKGSPSVDATFSRFIWLRGDTIIRSPGRFEHATLMVLVGAAKLDLRAATLAGAKLDVLILLGAIHVLVPDTTDVNERRAFVLGQRKLHYTSLPPPGAELTINILGLFGDVTVTRTSLWVPPREVVGPAPNSQGG